MPFAQRDRTLFRLFGIPIKANASWLILVALIVVSLTRGVFAPKLGEGVEWYVPWLLGTLAAAGLFGSLIIHELCHSLVARRTGTPVIGITLFIFGGVSQLGDEPPTAPAEFFMAVVGPLSSLAIGVAFLVSWLVVKLVGWPPAVQALLQCLFWVNFSLAGFNSLPAFPLDGGRILRSVLWAFTGNLRLATHVAARIGSFFGVALMALGILALLGGGGILGLWPLVLGFFLQQAARGSLQMVVMREHLQGEKARDFMTTDVVTVPQGIDVQEFVDRYVFHYLFSYYPVVDEAGKLVGVLGARAPRRINRQDWPVTGVGRLMKGIEESLILDPDTDAADALSLLSQRGENRAVVVRDGRPVGVLSMRDLLRFLALRVDLEPRGGHG